MSNHFSPTNRPTTVLCDKHGKPLALLFIDYTEIETAVAFGGKSQSFFKSEPPMYIHKVQGPKGNRPARVLASVDRTKIASN